MSIDIQVTDEQKKGIKEIEETQNQELVQAGELAIDSREDLEGAREFVLHLKMRKKKIEETLGEVRKANHAAWQKAQKLEKSFIDPIDKVITEITAKANLFLDKEEKERLEEENRLRALAEKKAEKCRKAMAKKTDKLLEGVKSDAEQIEILEKLLEGQAPDSVQAVFLHNKISFLQQNIDGAINKAENHHEEAKAPLPFAKPSVAPPSKTKGVSTKIKKVGVVIDKLALCRAVSSGLILPDVFKIDQVKINSLANSLKSIPGVEIKEDRKTSFR